MANRFHNPRPQFMNATPTVYVGGVLRFYISGTSTPKNVYSSDDLSTGAATSVTLNSAGRPSQDIWLSNALYKVTLEDSLGNLIWTVDPYYTSDYSSIARVQGYSGDPNTHVAGTASSGTVPADMVWDRTNQKLYVCVTTGDAAAAVWVVANFTELDTWTTAGRNVSPTAGVDFGYNTTLNAIEYWNGGSWRAVGKDMVVQRLASGSAATFTPTAGAVRWRIRMCGPGGGGGALATNVGGAGPATSFQVNGTGTAWTADFGDGGGNGSAPAGGAGGSGGTDGSTGTLIFRANGNAGAPGGLSGTAGVAPGGGNGGGSPFFGGGARGGRSTVAGSAAPANSGGGGGGAGANSGTASGAGGGSGECVEFMVAAGMTSAVYTVGTGGAGGAAGTTAGGDGGSGYIIVEEFFS